MNVDAVAAATMPRGAIQPMNARSPLSRSVLERGREGRDGPGHDDQGRDQDERRQDQVPERLRGYRGRNGDEQYADDELYEGLEERPAGRDVECPQIGQREAHEDRRDQPAVVTESIASGGHRDHRGELRAGPEHLAQPDLAQQQPEQRGADHAAGQPDRRRSAANCASWLPGPCWCSRRRRETPARPGCRRPGRSVTLPRSEPAAAVPSAGRKPSSGPTTVGPETTRMIPSITRRAARHAEQRRGQRRGERPGDRHAERRSGGSPPGGCDPSVCAGPGPGPRHKG